MLSTSFSGPKEFPSSLTHSCAEKGVEGKKLKEIEVQQPFFSVFGEEWGGERGYVS